MRRILVVDDDPEVVALLAERLHGEGHDVVAAADGYQALAALERGPAPDLVVLDVLMPGLSGWEVARAVRRDPRLRATPILVVTAVGRVLNQATSPLFADDFLDKPFDLDELDHKIDQLLRSPVRERP
jgi:CheY-like chemotaxis protein